MYIYYARLTALVIVSHISLLQGQRFVKHSFYPYIYYVRIRTLP